MIMLGYVEYERNEYGDDYAHEMGTGYIAQSFTPGTSHYIRAFRFKCYNSASCGDVTVKIYDTDGNGKPTGTALGTATIAQADIPNSDYGWIGGELDTSYLATNKKFIAVLHAAATGLYVKYQSVSGYENGSLWESTDGATWTENTSYDCVFQEWGLPLPSYGTYRLPFYPTAAGTHSELSGTFADVDDLLDSPDDSNGVGYDLGDNFLTGLAGGAAGRFLQSDGCGATALWKSGVAGLFGTGLGSRVAIGALVRTPTDNEFYTGGYRICKVSDKDDVNGLTFDNTPAGPTTMTGWNLSDIWFVTPETLAKSTTSSGPSSNAVDWKTYKLETNCGMVDRLPSQKLKGQWDFDGVGGASCGSGGDATTKFPDKDFAHNYIQPAWYGPTGAFNRGPMFHIDYVVDDNNVVLLHHQTTPFTCVLDEAGSCSLTWLDDLTDTDLATQWCAATKKASYVVKSTLNRQYIHQMSVRFRVKIEHYLSSTHGILCSEDASNVTFLGSTYGKLRVACLDGFKAGMNIKVFDNKGNSEDHVIRYISSPYMYTMSALSHLFLVSDFTEVRCSNAVKITATAKPFILLNGTYVYGTEQTITADESDAIIQDARVGYPWNAPRVWEFEETLARPGGGMFNYTDFQNSAMEVGIVLGNLSDISNNVKVKCTQLLMIADMSATPANILASTKSGIDDYGFIVFETPAFNGVTYSYDALGLPVINGYNPLHWKTYSFKKSIGSGFEAKPKVIHRSGRSRVLYGNSRKKVVV